MTTRSSLRRRALLAAASALLAGATADAASLPFTSTLSLQILSLDPVVVSGSGTATVNGSGPAGHLLALSLPSSPWATTAAIQAYTDPGVFPVAGVQLTMHNGAGAFTGSGGAGFGGVMPLLGAAKVCLYGACGSTNNIANLSIPLDVVGQGGFIGVVGGVYLTTVGAPWTTGTAAIGTLTAMGGVAPLSGTGAASGSVTLVTPFYVLTDIGAYPIVPGFATLTLHFVPEPGTLVLLGGGVAALTLWGRRRAQRSDR